MSLNLVKRLYSNIVKVRREHQSDCWEWQGSLSGKRYGSLSVGGKEVRTHRLSYLLSGRHLYKPKLYILHHCNNPLCIRPTHLYAGSQTDNMRQMVDEGRYKKGGPERAFGHLSDGELVLLLYDCLSVEEAVRRVGIRNHTSLYDELRQRGLKTPKHYLGKKR